MSLGAISQQFLQQVETVTGLPVHVEADERLQPPLLAKVQIARRGVPLHRVAYHPSARAMADYLIAFQCSFVLRLHSVPPSERFDLADAPGAQPDPMDWVRTHAASAHLPPDRQRAFADFLRTSLVSMLSSMPVGIWVDNDFRTRYPELREVREQALRRQIDTHAALYDVPKQHPVVGTTPPRIDLFAQAMAGKTATRLQPTGAYAANLLGLSEQVPAKVVFLTDGRSKRVRLGSLEIVLKQTTPRNMATAGTVSGSVIQALRYLGKDQVNDDTVKLLDRRLSADDRKQLRRDLVYAPAWIREIMRHLASSPETIVQTTASA